MRVIEHPLTPLIVFAVASFGCTLAYLAAGLDVTSSFSRIASLGWGLLLMWWVAADARKRGATPCFDFGFLCAVYLPVAIPWYCFWTRGWDGFRLLCGLLTLWIFPGFFAHLVWLAFLKG